MKLKEVIGDRLTSAGIDVSKLGDKFVSALEEDIDDAVGEEQKLLIKNLLTRTEAENDSTLVEKHKDGWHKLARKGVLDSVDSSIKGKESLLSESEKIEYEALDTVKKNSFLHKKYDSIVADLKSKIENSDSKADTKALEQELAAMNLKIEKDFVSKTQVAELEENYSNLKGQLQNFRDISEKDQLTALAIKSGNLSSALNTELVDDYITLAVKKYLATETFGTSGVKAKIVLDSNGKVTLRQADTAEEVSVIESNKPLSVQEIVVRAIQKYDLSKKQAGGEEEEFNKDTPDPKKKESLKYSESELANAWL
jgi:hypothetical protein